MSADPWDELQEYVAAEGGPTFPSLLGSLEWYALALAGEVGEACNVIKKIRRDDGERLTSERREHLQDELIDSLVYLMILLFRTGVPMNEAFARVRAAHEAFMARPR